MHIVAMGGGGFLMEPENPLLDDYILSLARNRSPRVCFVPTAAGDSENFIVRFFTAFSEKNASPHTCLSSSAMRKAFAILSFGRM